MKSKENQRNKPENPLATPNDLSIPMSHLGQHSHFFGFPNGKGKKGKNKEQKGENSDIECKTASSIDFSHVG